MIALPTIFSAAASGCNLSGGSFLGFPKWYEYLSGTPDAAGHCIPVVNSLSDIWLIVAAIIEILLRVAGVAAVLYLIYGGVQYTISSGDSNKVSKAKDAIIAAVVGLVIAVASATIVAFLAKSL